MVAAAGNDNCSSESYPASYSQVICVAATNKSNARSNFSNYGSQIDIAAPGGDTGAYLYAPDSAGQSKYIGMAGTSQATPVVAGAIALYISAYGNPGIETLKQELQNTGTDITTDQNIGGKLLNLASFLKIPYTLGDVDLNGTIDENDILILRRYIVGMENFNSKQTMSADINKDGMINAIDVTILRRKAA